MYSEETADNKTRLLIFEDAKVKESHILDYHDLRWGFWEGLAMTVGVDEKTSLPPWDCRAHARNDDGGVRILE
jgi:hypothetical protein